MGIRNHKRSIRTGSSEDVRLIWENQTWKKLIDSTMGPKRKRKEALNSELVAFLRRELNECRDKDNVNVVSIPLARMIREIRNFGEVITSVEQAKQIKYVGPVTVRYIETFFKNRNDQIEGESESVGYMSQNIPVSGGQPRRGVRPKPRELPDELLQTDTSTRSKYTPRLRSGSWALVLCLFRAEAGAFDGPCSLSKDQLIVGAQPLSDAHMDASSDPLNRYSGWSDMKTLVKHNLCERVPKSRPNRFRLTDDGRELAVSLELGRQRLGLDDRGLPDPVDSNDSTLAEENVSWTRETFGTTTTTTGDVDSSFPEFPENSLDVETPVTYYTPSRLNPTQRVKDTPSRMRAAIRTMLAHDPTGDKTHSLSSGETYVVTLLVDSRERSRAGGLGHLVDSFVSSTCPVEERQLSVGDFLWVMRPKGEKEYEELVLDFIVERKRYDDLVSSIIDGRFKEQKFRLLQSVKNVIYLVEGNTRLMSESGGSLALPAALNQNVHRARAVAAIMEMMVFSGIFVKQTKDTNESIEYLQSLTSTLQCMVSEGELNGSKFSSFSEFSRGSSKQNETVQLLFAKQLKQLPGVGGEVAHVVSDCYPTPFLLRKALNSAPSMEEKIRLLAGRTSENVARRRAPVKIPPKAAATIAEFYSSHSTDPTTNQSH